MIRKTIFALAATAAIVASALPSDAFAKKGGFHHGGRFWVGVGIATLGAAALASCYQYQWVQTPYGLRQVPVNVCD